MCGFIFYSSNDLSKEILSKSLACISHRGPDDKKEIYKDAYLSFQRLSVMDLSHAGDQPFMHQGSYLMCNGEIYNFKELAREHSLELRSSSDCEILLPLFNKLSKQKFVQSLDGEYAFVVFNSKDNEIFAARDPMGIRPLFYGFSKESGKIAFASEVKALKDFCSEIQAFPPGHYYFQGEFKSFHCHWEASTLKDTDLSKTTLRIQKLLVDAVKKRIISDAPIGFLLSGGLDSSLVCSIAQKALEQPIKTFAIGMSEDAIDLKYAASVAKHIGSSHHEVLMKPEDVISSLRNVIYTLETFDITTIRASIGMYLVCKYIHENTDIKVLLTGEVSDELFGYKYTDFAPNSSEFQKDSQKRVKELYLYDVLRADRCISAHSLEARVPFSDKYFVDYIMSINPDLKMNTYGHGKYLLRKAFSDEDYLPESILFREKAAFSDAVGHSMVNILKSYADSIYTDKDFETRASKFKHATPFTKESLLYREIFEEFYPGMSYLIPDFWMPNKEWLNFDVQDPSARVLPNYGQSGS